MDSEVKMFLLIRRVFFCMGHVLGRQRVCGVPVDGISTEDGTDTSNDLVNLSNDSMSTRGKAFTDSAMLLDIQSCT